MLLTLYQKCWRGEGIPTFWRVSVIKTLLEEDKDSVSHRPISLTSCLGKILKKIITNCLIYIFEDKRLLTENQMGFRPGRSTVNKLVQEASDNMHSNPRVLRTMTAFFLLQQGIRYSLARRVHLQNCKMIQLKFTNQVHTLCTTFS